MHYPSVAGLDFRQNAAANLRMCFIVEIGAGRYVVRPPILMLADQIEGGMGGVTGFLLGRAGRQDVGQDFILRRDELDHRIVLRPERVRDDKAPHAYGHAHDRLLCFREARTMPDVAAFAAHVGTPNQPVHAGSIFQLCGRPVVSTKATSARSISCRTARTWRASRAPSAVVR